MTVIPIENAPVNSICYLCYNKALSNDCFIVDPGAENEAEVIQIIREFELNLSYIILTHEHFDHCMGVNQVRASFPNSKLVCSSACSEAIQLAKKNYSLFFRNPGFECGAADIVLEDIGWSLHSGGYDISFYPAQGHSKAGVIFVVDTYVFTGDSLIKDIKTVTKLKTGSKERLHDSLCLIEGWKGMGYIICPGHGEMFELDNYDLSKALG